MLKPLMTIAVLLSIFGFAYTANAQPPLAPPAFAISTTEKAIFVDFIEARYSLEYDVQAHTAVAKSIITFTSDEVGSPIFDLVNEPTKIQLNGADVTQRLITFPDNVNKARLVENQIEVGTHTLVIENNLDVSGISKNGVDTFFTLSDAQYRYYLERYLPSNFEFDQLRMSIHVTIKNGTSLQSIQTNGEVQINAVNDWLVTYPEYYTSSSIFLRLSTNLNPVQDNYVSQVSGKTTPLYVFPDTNLTPWVKKYLAQFEMQYGEYPFPSLIVFTGGGSMEYAGAIESRFKNLKHEIAHMWFARGVMPANGDAQWIDEAMAVFMGGGDGTPFPLYTDLSHVGKLSSMLSYGRTFNSDYKSGPEFLSYLNDLFVKKSPTRGMAVFMASWYQARVHQVVTNEIFQADLEAFYGESLEDLFKRYVYQ